MVRKILFVFFHCFVSVCDAQQVNDTIVLKPVEIIESKITLFSTGIKINEMDSITKLQSRSANLGEMLSSENLLFIKSYGSGGIATASFRGTEARHTAILWNGFSINSPSLGLCDLALIPSSFFDRISVVHGATSSLNGTSSLGGIIELKNNPLFKKGSDVQLSTEIGSVGTFSSQLQINAGTENFLSNSKVIYENDKNNFTFENSTLFGSPEQKQKHAHLLNYGIMQNFYLRINPTSIISSGIWYQVTHREIPPLMTVIESQAEQQDSVLRIFLSYQKTFHRSALTVRAAYFDEYELYTDPVPEIYSPYKIKSYKTEGEYRFYILENFLVNAGGAFNRYAADFTEYNGIIRRNTYSAYAGFKYIFPFELTAELAARKEFTEGSEPSVIPSVGFEKKFFKQHITIKARGSKNFNLPALNDLYWEPGGNPLLKPETAWSYEAGVDAELGKNKNLETGFAFFSTKTNDWIQWQPTPYGYYAPYNLKKVHARGAEFTINYKGNFQNSVISFHANYSYTRSTNLETEQVLGEEITGKQLIYIPEHLAGIKMMAVYKGFAVTYTHTFTGSRYTTSDNSDFLPFYFLANIRADKNILLKKISLNLFISVHNIYNEQYQAMAYRAMPGRYYSLGTTITFTKS